MCCGLDLRLPAHISDGTNTTTEEILLCTGRRRETPTLTADMEPSKELPRRARPGWPSGNISQRERCDIDAEGWANLFLVSICFKTMLENLESLKARVFFSPASRSMDQEREFVPLPL